MSHSVPPPYRARSSGLLRFTFLLFFSLSVLWAGGPPEARSWVRLKDGIKMETLKKVVLFQRVYAIDTTGCTSIPGSTYYMKTWDLYCVLVEITNFHAMDPYLQSLPRGFHVAGPAGPGCVGPHTSFAAAAAIDLQELRSLESRGLVHISQIHFVDSGFDEVPFCDQLPIPGGGGIPGGSDPCDRAWLGRPPRMTAKVFVREDTVWTGATWIPVLIHRWSHQIPSDPATTFWDFSSPDPGYPPPDGGCGDPVSHSSLNLGGAIRALFVDDNHLQALRAYLGGSK